MLERGDREVRDDVERVPAPGGPPGNRRDDWLGHRAHEPLHLQDVQTPRPCRIDLLSRLALGVAVTITAANPLIPAGTEGPPRIFGARTVSGEDDGGNVGAHPGVVEGPVQLAHGVAAECVAPLRAVEGDANHGEVPRACPTAVDTAVRSEERRGGEEGGGRELAA